MSNTHNVNVKCDFNGREVIAEVEVLMGRMSFDYYQPDDPDEISIVGAYYNDTGDDLTDDEIEELHEDDDFYKKAVDFAQSMEMEGYDGEEWL